MMDAQSIAIIVGAACAGLATIITAYRTGLNKPSPGCTCSGTNKP